MNVLLYFTKYNFLILLLCLRSSSMYIQIPNACNTLVSSNIHTISYYSLFIIYINILQLFIIYIVYNIYYYNILKKICHYYYLILMFLYQCNKYHFNQISILSLCCLILLQIQQVLLFFHSLNNLSIHITLTYSFPLFNLIVYFLCMQYIL